MTHMQVSLGSRSDPGVAVVIYANARAFRQALNNRLSSLANIQQMAASRLQRKVAFERFLARVSQHTGEQLEKRGGVGEL